MVKKRPLVSVIVPAKNSAEFLDACLRSIQNQTYKPTELIVVDNSSTDETQLIAKRYTDKVYTKGPERSAQVNYGVTKARGEYVYKVDSDFVLDPLVIEQCVTEIQKGYDAIVVHNSPDVRVSWIARIRKFEVDMYKYDLTHSSARFVKKEVYRAIGGFNSQITAGEDYDFQNKLNRQGYKTGFIDAEALHLGEPKKLWPHLKKYYTYGKDLYNSINQNKQEHSKQVGFVRGEYVRHIRNMLSRLFLLIIFIWCNTAKYVSGAFGLIYSWPVQLIQTR